MLDRIGVLEDDVRTARRVAAELAEIATREGLWMRHAPGVSWCVFCDEALDHTTYIYRRWLDGQADFPHTDACPYAAGLRIAAEDARGRD